MAGEERRQKGQSQDLNSTSNTGDTAACDTSPGSHLALTDKARNSERFGDLPKVTDL